MTRQKELSIREMNIISGAEKSTALHILWLRYCAQFVDPFESFEWRMGFTIGEKRVVDPRNGYHYWGLEIYCFAYFVAEVLFTVCRSVQTVQMENGIHDPRKELSIREMNIISEA